MKAQTYNFFQAQSGGGHSVNDGIIHGVAIVTEGEARGHGVYVDSKFLEDVAEQGNSTARGIKVRFGHPGFFGTDAVGTYVGRIKNFRIEGETVRGDLHLSKVAKSSPKGDFYSYILGMAENEPDMFGLSIAFDSNGTYSVDGKEFVVLNKLHAVDIVDEPAANPGGLFHAKIEEENSERHKEMDLNELKKWVEAFGAEKACEYFSNGLSFEEAEKKIAEEVAAAEVESLKAAIVEKDAKIASLEVKLADLEAKLAEMDKGVNPVASVAASATIAETFETLVRKHKESGKSDDVAIRCAVAERPDLHKIWLSSAKSLYNKVI